MASPTVTAESAETVCLVIPILPGLGEAWRRFAQELQGPRYDEWRNWQERMKLQSIQYSMQSTLQNEVILLQAQFMAGSRIPQQLIDDQVPFDRWLRGQLLHLHGVDLAQIGPNQKWSLGGFQMRVNRSNL